MTRTLPPEWAPQSGVMLTWPHGHGDWGAGLDAVEKVFVAMAVAISRHERLVAACYDQQHLEHVRGLVLEAGGDPGNLSLHAVASNDVWVRDHGPITVLRGETPLLLDFTFNGWGRKYPHALDNAVTRSLHADGAFAGTALESVALVLEGGSIESDGAGTLLTTTSCLLSPQRNPEFDCIGLEGIFADLFGTRQVLWLEHGELEGDDTDGHVDTLARFCDPQTIAYVRCDEPSDSHFAPLRRMEAQLKGFTDAEGRPYRLVPLPMPAPKLGADGRRLPATYANFLIINGAVLVPTYDDPADAVALESLAACFPTREMVAIDALALVEQSGSIHCASMQLPKGVV